MGRSRSPAPTVIRPDSRNLTTVIPTTHMHTLLRKCRSITRYWRHNGSYLLVHKLSDDIFHGIRDWFISRAAKSPPLKLGKSPKLMGLSHIAFGHNFRCGKNLWLEAVTEYRGVSYDPRILIGNDVCVSDDVHIGSTGSVTIGDGVLIGSRVTIIDHNHGKYSGDMQSDANMPPSQRPLTSGKSVVIEDNVWIAEGVTILPGATVGRGSIIGANSVVVGAIPAYCIATGSPARPIRKFNHEQRNWIKWN